MKLVICIPGNNFSGAFLDSFIEFYHWCLHNGIHVLLSRKESCNIYYVRNMCLGGNVQGGKSQKPWGGKLDYDYMLWIDSDIVFNPQDFIKLLQMEVDIASGLYLMTNGSREPNQFATVVDWDEKFFEKNGYFKFVQREDIVGETKPFVADYTGFGFILIKKGVFESLDYPWFQPIFFNIGNAHDFCMEDVGFCLKAKEKGHKVWINPQVIVKHEKKILLST